MTTTDSRPGTEQGEGGAPGRDWLAQALCAQVNADDEVWFPHRGGSPAEAQRICLLCTVRRECLEFALAQPNLREGIFGGATPKMRQKMRAAS
jgi:WhiB family redox-sensing transcriptional regulator